MNTANAHIIISLEPFALRNHVAFVHTEVNQALRI